MAEDLEELFQKTAGGQAGECPLPEPGRGAPHIEHSDHMRIRKQPSGYNYDEPIASSDKARFLNDVEQALANKRITPEEAILLRRIA